MKNQKRNILLSVGSRAISRIGDVMFDFANNTFLTGLGTRSVFFVGTYQATETIIGILFNIFGGAIADNFKRKKIIIYTDFLSGIACILASFIYKKVWLAYAIIIVNIFLAIMDSFSSPAYKAYTKEIVKINRISRLNSYLETSSTIVKVTIPAVSVFLYGLLKIQGTLLLDGCSFIISTILLYFTQPLTKDYGTEKFKDKFELNKIFRDIFEGMRYLVNNKRILSIVILSAWVNFFLAAYNLLLPYSNKAFHASSINLYAMFLVSEALGGLIGAILSGFLNKKLSINRLIIFLGLSGLSLLLLPIIYVLFNNSVLLNAFPFSFNLFLTIFNVQFFSIVQREVDNEYIGRVFGIIFTVALLFMPIGTAVFSITLNVSNSFNFVFIGGSIIVLALFFKIFNHFLKLTSLN